MTTYIKKYEAYNIVRARIKYDVRECRITNIRYICNYPVLFFIKVLKIHPVNILKLNFSIFLQTIITTAIIFRFILKY